MKKLFLLGLILSSFFGAASTEAAEEDWFGFLEEPLGEVQMRGIFLDGEVLEIEVLAKDMQKPILGTAFHLKYPADRLSFLKYEPGDFLERGGDPIYLVTDKGGVIVFGQTLKREDSFPVGDGVIGKFYFEIAGKRDFLFEFENGVVSTLETVRQDLDMIKWFNLHIDEEKQTLISQNEELNFLNESRDNGPSSGSKVGKGVKMTALLSGILTFLMAIGGYFIYKFIGHKRTA